ncbi:MAG TPA: 6-oxocyclohex-1-ene-1-carbonyl-CoA hydratase [Bacteroidota bacterium]|nr:6-oxocyclohex-1-ene-1-carbonyl-CoA hydratase [Bacteroidota bacterium]
MTLDWIPRDHAEKSHDLWGSEFLGTEPPCTMYELRPVRNSAGAAVGGLHCAWITLNNPAQYNSYTTGMVKGVIAAFHRASMDRSVVAVVFTAIGDKAFCTGGNTKEYAEYYGRRPNEYGAYIDLFVAMVDGILNCRKPVICRVNGMRVAGGQEIGMACDVTVSADTAVFGQAGPRHGSAPDGGSTDFLPLFLNMENAMWNCVSCDVWSAYKMVRLGMITKAIPVLKIAGTIRRNPLVVTDTYVQDGEIVYGEPLRGRKAEEAREEVKKAEVDFTLLDREVDEIVWRFTNLMPGCLIKSIDGIRAKKKFFWDQAKLPNRHWLAANMAVEGFLGFTAFNTRKLTGTDVIDFVKYRQYLAEGRLMDEATLAELLPRPKGS